jgi:hypothetical protein
MLRLSFVRGLLVAGALVVAAPGCASGLLSSKSGGAGLLPRAPAEQGRCRVAASQSSPLVTEWPASEKANLEVLLRNGAVAVAYSGCSMRVLAECRVKGEYHWQRTTPASDSLEINDADELYAKLPLGAASLEGELKRSGKLAVQTMVSGQLRLDNVAVADVPREGPCAQATHIVSGLSLGAFALKGGGKREGSAGVNVTAIGEAKAKREQSADLLRSAGDFDSCAASTAESPHANCASPIQAFLAPLPGRTEEEGPPGTVKVDFVSGDAASRWDVYADDVVICTTPCARYVNAERPVMLRARDEAFMGSPDKVRVTNLLAVGGGHLQLQAHGTARGQLATGISFTALTGMGVITGITLASVGCFSSDEHGFCTPGLITLGVTAPLLAASIWLITDSMPRAEVVSPDAGPTLLARPTKPTVVFGPGFVSGVF